MNQEIERKFIVDPQNEKSQELINGSDLVIENRYYLYKNDGIEIRFTSLLKNGGEANYTLDRMEVQDELLVVRTKQRWQILKEEFDSLLAILLVKTPDAEPVIRYSYTVSEKPKTEIKVYKGKFEGLVRAEVEFESLDICSGYQPQEWMGTEISNSPIGNDIILADLSEAEFSKNIKNFLG